MNSRTEIPDVDRVPPEGWGMTATPAESAWPAGEPRRTDGCGGVVEDCEQ